MDCKKVGELLYQLRKEKSLTQKQLADELNITEQAISKWERGMGCPDVSLLKSIAKIYNINIESILSGEIVEKARVSGNISKIKFYFCPHCQNVITCLEEADISCCGRKLNRLFLSEKDDVHQISWELIENDYYISIRHPMEKNHYISFVAYVTYDRTMIIKLYPEQSAEVRIPRGPKGKIFFYCVQHGLFVSDL